MNNSFFKKFNLFSTKLILLSIFCGIISSCWLGFKIYRQTTANFDKKITIADLEKKLTSINDLSAINSLTIQDISQYNRKIAYSRLLEKLKPQDFSIIENQEILQLKDNYTATAHKSYAVWEYGIVIIFLCSIFSTGLTIPVFLLIFCAAIFIFHGSSDRKIHL